ncbi:unnamed protein product [Symbiodinium sp. CCMP2592]|nr:unnamed protein product [Symbiodinium sp. CCMP2592]
MMRLVGMVPSQSAAERANGLLQRCGGDTKQNNLLFSTRVDVTTVGCKYNAMARIQRGRKRKAQHMHWDEDHDLSADSDAESWASEGAALGFRADPPSEGEENLGLSYQSSPSSSSS